MSYSIKAEEKNREKWRASLESAMTDPEEPVIAITFRRGWNSAARPVLVRCIDKNEYIIKGQQAGRQIINDQIVARLGVAIGAPVGQPEIIEISQELIEEDSAFSYLTPGTAHGTIYIADCFDDRETRQYANQQKNRPRFALLCVLYGWTYGQDHQFIYKKTRPNLVYSVDHGHFFPGGPNWTENNLRQAPIPELDKRLLSTCNLTQDEIEQALLVLKAVDEETIIQAVRIRNIIKQHLKIKNEAKKILKTNYSVSGTHGNNEFDVVVANGQPYLAAHGMSFEVHIPTAIQNSVSWMISDVKNKRPDFPLAIVVLPPRQETSDYKKLESLYKQNRSTYLELGAAVLVEDEIESWVSPKIRSLMKDRDG